MSTMREFCLDCGKERDVRREKKQVEFDVKGETIILELPVKTCLACCTEEVELPDGQDPVDLAFREYRRRHQLLIPDEIKRIRDGYNLSQRSFALLLGMSEATVNRYEGGSIQETTHDSLIRACESPEFIRGQLKRRGKLLSDSQRARAEEALQPREQAVGSRPLRQIELGESGT